MVYESDFYTTRRPYRYTPSYSTYTVSTVPSRQVRVLPGLGKVHIVHSYDRIVPYVGHKRLTVVTSPPKVYSTRPSVLQRQFDWIENRVRPWVAYSATNNYLNSNSAVRIVYNRYPGLWQDSYSSSSFYRKCGPVSRYSGTYWPYDEYWPNYTPSVNWSYRPLWRPYYRYLKNYVSTPLYRSYYLENWVDRYTDWCYNYWPRDTSRYHSCLDTLPSTRSYYWYWPTYYPRRMVYARSPISGLYYPNYLPSSNYTNYYRITRPIYSSDYWPYASLNYLTNWWPRYRYYVDDDDLSYRSLRMQRIFDDETRLIRAQTNSLLKSIHLPVPRHRTYPITALNRYGEYPARHSNDHYIHRLLQISPKNSKVEFVTYYTEPVKKYIGQGHLSCVSYVGDRGAYGRRRNVYVYEDPVKNDIQLLSFYINKFREEKQQKAIEPAKVPLSPVRPSRRFNSSKQLSDETSQEIEQLREARAARLAKINAADSSSVEDALKAKKQREEARLAEEKALAEEQAAKESKEAKEKKERAAREAADRAAELERQAELLKQEEIAKQAELERARKEEKERLKAEEERRLADEAKAEEERKQLLRLEEIARQAEDEREAELARQAEELAELARQEAELAEQAKREAEAEELARQEEELAELKRQEEELAELERQERELAEAAEQAKLEAELASQAANEEPQPEQDELDAPHEEITAEETEEPQLVEEKEATEILDEEPALDLEVEVKETEETQPDEPAENIEVEEDEEEPLAEAEDVPTAQEDTADEAEDEEEE